MISDVYATPLEYKTMNKTSDKPCDAVKYNTGKQWNPAQKNNKGKSKRNALLFKTRLCNIHKDADDEEIRKCSFAHSPWELMSTANRFKNTSCRDSAECKDVMCRFVHIEEERLLAALWTSTTIHPQRANCIAHVDFYNFLRLEKTSLYALTQHLPEHLLMMQWIEKVVAYWVGVNRYEDGELPPPPSPHPQSYTLNRPFSDTVREEFSAEPIPYVENYQHKVSGFGTIPYVEAYKEPYTQFNPLSPPFTGFIPGGIGGVQTGTAPVMVPPPMSTPDIPSYTGGGYASVPSFSGFAEGYSTAQMIQIPASVPAVPMQYIVNSPSIEAQTPMFRPGNSPTSPVPGLVPISVPYFAPMYTPPQYTYAYYMPIAVGSTEVAAPDAASACRW